MNSQPLNVQTHTTSTPFLCTIEGNDNCSGQKKPHLCISVWNCELRCPLNSRTGFYHNDNPEHFHDAEKEPLSKILLLGTLGRKLYNCKSCITPIDSQQDTLKNLYRMHTTAQLFDGIGVVLLSKTILDHSLNLFMLQMSC